jgi:hypothetical protein
MIPKRYTSLQLKKLDGLYNSAVTSGSDPDFPKYYSRLAVLEVGGWIEDSMDDLVRLYSRRKRIKIKAYLDYVEEIIGRNYGFGYENNFKKMMRAALGATLLSNVESGMDVVKKQALESALSVLYPERNQHAHRSIRTAISFTAPSVCQAHFNDVYTGLKEFERILKSVV